MQPRNYTEDPLDNRVKKCLISAVQDLDAGNELWVAIQANATPSAVTSVFGRQGNVVAAAGDYQAAQVTNALDATATYTNPPWLVQVSGAIISGNIAGEATSITGTITESQVVNLTSDLSNKAPLASPSFIGMPTAPTASVGTNTTQLATCAFVLANAGSGGGAVSSVFGRTGAVVAATNDYTVAQVTGAAPLASPALTGVPTAPTATFGTNTTQVATCAFVLANAGSGGGGGMAIGGTVAGGTATRVLYEGTGAVLADSANFTFDGTNLGCPGMLVGSGNYQSVRGATATNVFLGPGAGAPGTTASLNLGMGLNALAAVTSGDYNVAIGYNSCQTLTTGQSNMAIGGNTLALLTIGTQNTAIGLNAGHGVTTGSNNVMLGYNAGTAITSGSGNFAMGSQALSSMTTGSNNLAIGANAGLYLDAVSNNLLLGPGAGSNSLGMTDCVGIGGSSLIATTGTANTGIGGLAGQTNTTGGYNTFIGYGADATSGGFSASTAIGVLAKVNASNQIMLGRASETVVIPGPLNFQRASSTTPRTASVLDSAWVNSTDATRTGQLLLKASDYSGTDREGLRIESDGTQAKIGAFGAAAVARPTVTGSKGGNAALASLLTALAQLGWITDSSS